MEVMPCFDAAAVPLLQLSALQLTPNASRATTLETEQKTLQQPEVVFETERAADEIIIQQNRNCLRTSGARGSW